MANGKCASESGSKQQTRSSQKHRGWMELRDTVSRVPLSNPFRICCQEKRHESMHLWQSEGAEGLCRNSIFGLFLIAEEKSVSC